jgi:hypothetical protein
MPRGEAVEVPEETCQLGSDGQETKKYGRLEYEGFIESKPLKDWLKDLEVEGEQAWQRYCKMDGFLRRDILSSSAYAMII